MSLISGWLPIAIHVVALVVLLVAIGWRSRRWRLLWVPVAVLLGVVLATAAYWYVGYQGWGHDACSIWHLVVDRIDRSCGRSSDSGLARHDVAPPSGIGTGYSAVRVVRGRGAQHIDWLPSHR